VVAEFLLAHGVVLDAPAPSADDTKKFTNPIDAVEVDRVIAESDTE
jgi:hypothetical protein